MFGWSFKESGSKSDAPIVIGRLKSACHISSFPLDKDMLLRRVSGTSRTSAKRCARLSCVVVLTGTRDRNGYIGLCREGGAPEGWWLEFSGLNRSTSWQKPPITRRGFATRNEKYSHVLAGGSRVVFVVVVGTIETELRSKVSLLWPREFRHRLQS